MHHKPVFSATLTPHLSLGSTGRNWVLGVFFILTLIPAIFFYLAGAWPIVGFMGLDVIALFWAFRLSKHAANAYEEISLWPDRLQIHQVSPEGKTTIKTLNPFWVRLNYMRDFDNQITHIKLKINDEIHEIGSFLNPDDKTSFAQAFATALARVKN